MTDKIEKHLAKTDQLQNGKIYLEAKNNMHINALEGLQAVIDLQENKSICSADNSFLLNAELVKVSQEVQNNMKEINELRTKLSTGKAEID